MGNKAILFSGQGAQFVGMGKDLAEAYPESKALFDRANEVLGYSLSGICFEGPEESLTRSDYCQPAIFVTSMACYAALRTECPDLEFAGAAGLSLGEWTALHMAGALSFEDTLKVLEARGRFMQEACEEREGGMVSVIGLPEDKVREIAAAAIEVNPNLHDERPMIIVLTALDPDKLDRYSARVYPVGEDGTPVQYVGEATYSEGTFTLKTEQGSDGTRFNFSGTLEGKDTLSGGFDATAWWVLKNAMSGHWKLDRQQ